MASLIPISQSNPQLNLTNKKCFKINPHSPFNLSLATRVGSIRLQAVGTNHKAAGKVAKGVIVSQINAQKSNDEYQGETIMNGFVEEMRSEAMRLHTKEQAPKEGTMKVKGPEQRHVSKWDPTIDGYLRFLVDSKLVYDTLEGIIEKAHFPCYTELKDTGLERSGKLAKDLEWFKEQGYVLPKPGQPGVTHSQYIKELSENNSQAIVCHFYNLYFGHTAGGRIMGKKVGEKILNNKILEFYKWDDDVSQLLHNAVIKLNKVAESWTKEEKNRCLEETETAFKYYGSVIRLIMS